MHQLQIIALGVCSRPIIDSLAADLWREARPPSFAWSCVWSTRTHVLIYCQSSTPCEILLQCTCEQVVIAWGQQTWSFLYQNNHKVTILFPCIQSSETVCPKSCTEYPTDVIPPSYVLLWTCPLVDPCISNKTSRRPRVLTHSLANRAISVLQSCKSSLLRTSTNVVAYITSKLLMTD
jgi:hypothetical protein